MEWIGIDSQMAADAMMERLDGMHDWYVSGFHTTRWAGLAVRI